MRYPPLVSLPTLKISASVRLQPIVGVLQQKNFTNS
ncbi:hypothetical protein F442_00896 [Phytophthora nicotianae P10297]|uniref:Uncharacterized protein n=1 Tax=Phytophthora nicotianae P10297 TaxID=1317064 RepID=W3A555_PHYNI|nr:hypothetical protein F442_00896 [Phytophthora nicotianae P10297]